MLQRMESECYFGNSCKATGPLSIQSPCSATFRWYMGATSEKLQNVYDCYLRKSTLDSTSTRTTMCLVQQTLNSRPLTHVSDDPEDLEAITPNHFLLDRPAISEPLIPDASRYVNSRKLYRVSQAYHE